MKSLKTVHLTKHMVTHMNKELTADIDGVENLQLDQNSISKLENLSHLTKLQQLSAGHNCLIKISGLESLHQLTVLSLPENSICAIEGISHLKHLTWLNLSGNNIRFMAGLETTLSLKHLDLSDNSITQLADVSHLTLLKSLLLHGNIIRDLRQASELLPNNLRILSLAENEINELVQVSNLSPLPNLEQLSIMNNPCVTYQQLTHHSAAYRAYVLSLCMTLNVLDGQQVNEVERENAVALTEDGVPTRFSTGDHGKLVIYLSKLSNSLSRGRQLPKASPQKNTPQKNITPNKHSHSVVRRARSEERLNEKSADQKQQERPTTALGHKITKPGSPGSSSPYSSPVAPGREQQFGLTRHVIGQEWSPGKPQITQPSSVQKPTRSSAMPGMSRSRSPSLNRQTGAPRQLTNQITDVNQPLYSTQNALSPDSATKNIEKKSVNHKPDVEKIRKELDFSQRFYINTHHYAAVTIQARWRGYHVRNLNPRINAMKQEVRTRRLEDTMAFLVEEVNKQQKINRDGQKLRGLLVAGMKALQKQVSELQTMLYTDPSAV